MVLIFWVRLIFKVVELEWDKRDLERQVNELKAKIDQVEKRNSEQRASEEKKHAEDITFYKKTNQQLKVSSRKIFRISLFDNVFILFLI